MFWGVPSEPPLRMAIEAAKEAGVRFVIFNQRRSQEYDITVDVGSEGVDGEICIDGARRYLKVPALE